MALVGVLALKSVLMRVRVASGRARPGRWPGAGIARGFGGMNWIMEGQKFQESKADMSSL
jgi:hypothetical protein